MRVKTSELEGAALDWAVGKAAGYVVYAQPDGPLYRPDNGKYWSPSIDWGQGGPLIDRYIGLTQHDQDDSCEPFYAEVRYASKEGYANGTTLLVAAMRAIVAAELGDAVDVPEELCSE